MDRSGAGGGAYLLHSSVSIRSGERKHLLFIAKLEQKDPSGPIGAAGVSAAAGLNVPR
jgi:hypothetical protein